MLFDPEASDFDRALLRSWEGQGPSASARAKILALGGAVGGAAIVGTVAGGSIPPKAGVAALGVAKWLAAIAVVAGAAATTTAVVHHVTSTSTRVETSAPVAPPAPAPAPPPRVEAEAKPTADPPPAPTVVPHAPAPRASDLAGQVAALDRARSALQGGDAARARRLVDDYEARYPAGAFVQEAEIVRIEALVKQGDRAGAKAAGARFVAQYPSSPHVPRVRALLAP
jgi:TolA-binding protein